MRHNQILRRVSLMSAILAPLAASGCSPSGSFKITAMPSDLTLEERVVQRHPGWVSDRIAMIDISGILINGKSPGLFSEGEHVVSLIVEKLRAAAADKRVKAVVLRINSPGGGVTPSAILHAEIKAFRKNTGKPVVAYFQDVAASGAYYLACATDEIIAQKTTITGSIGVIMQMIDLSGTMTKLGIRADAIKSADFKDAGSPFREMKPEERAVFQEIVDGFYAQFLEVVEQGRPKMTKASVVKLADGRVYTAQQALDSGLIDVIGTIHDAFESARRRAGIDAAHVVAYHRPLSWTPNVYATAPASAPAFTFMNINLPDYWTKRPRFMYIWSIEE